jgi:Nucleotidyl transferase
MSNEVQPFILCGGAGTRLWPLSREAFPKQFHRLTGPRSLFQETCARLSGGIFGKLSVLSNQQHRFLIQEQLQEIGLSDADIVLEPIGRNTAPAACVAALVAGSANPDALVPSCAIRSRDWRQPLIRREREPRCGGGAQRLCRDVRRPAGLPAHWIRIYRNEWRRSKCRRHGEALH